METRTWKARLMEAQVRMLKEKLEGLGEAIRATDWVQVKMEFARIEQTVSKIQAILERGL